MIYPNGASANSRENHFVKVFSLLLSFFCIFTIATYWPFGVWVAMRITHFTHKHRHRKSTIKPEYRQPKASEWNQFYLFNFPFYCEMFEMRYSIVYFIGDGIIDYYDPKRHVESICGLNEFDHRFVLLVKMRMLAQMADIIGRCHKNHQNEHVYRVSKS